jgi:hypothetical protein
MVERRLHPRRLVNARVMLFHESIGHVEGRTVDVSDGGLFVASDAPPHLRTGENVKVHLMDSSNPRIAFNMKVIRCTAEGYGLMFLDYEIDGQRRSIGNLRREYAKRKQPPPKG